MAFLFKKMDYVTFLEAFVDAKELRKRLRKSFDCNGIKRGAKNAKTYFLLDEAMD